jgi:hypothetical protein
VTLSTGTAFTVVQQPTSSTIVSGTAVTFQIAFNPLTTGTFSDTVTIQSNDSNEGTYTFMIVGETKFCLISLPLIIR